MKIRYVLLNAYSGGGTVRTTLGMAGALAARGHEVEVVSLRRHRASTSFEVPPGVRLVPLGGPPRPRLRDLARRPLRSAHWALRAGLNRVPSRTAHPDDHRYTSFSLGTDLALLRYLRAQRGGAVIGTRAGVNLAIARLARPDVISIGQEHLHVSRARPALRQAYRENLGRLDAVVSLTCADAQGYRDLLGDRAPRRVLAIPNAVPDVGTARAGLAPQATVLVAAGRLTRQKGFDLLVKAWQKVGPAHPDWVLRIHGEGHLRADLEAQVAAAGLQGSVQLPGFTAALPAELAEAGAFVLSSRFEGFPMVLLEAMAVGLPVVAYDCPTGPGELIEHGVDGLLVTPGSVAALADALTRLLADHALRVRLGTRAAATSSRYSQSAVAQRWEALLEELAAGRG